MQQTNTPEENRRFERAMAWTNAFVITFLLWQFSILTMFGFSEHYWPLSFVLLLVSAAMASVFHIRYQPQY